MTGSEALRKGDNFFLCSSILYRAVMSVDCQRDYVEVSDSLGFELPPLSVQDAASDCLLLDISFLIDLGHYCIVRFSDLCFFDYDS